MKKMKAITLFKDMSGEDVTMPTGLVVDSVSTDSRSVAAGALFFALSGENFDGARFVVSAFEKGAAAAVVCSSVIENTELYGEILHYATEHGRALFLANDTRVALGEAAAIYLRHFSPVVIGVTGSSGKTTTRAIIETLLSGDYNVHATSGNYNNDIGLPLTVFGLQEEHDVLLLEMGMNHAGELRWLAEIAHPSLAVITNIGTAHLEYFKTQKAIAEAKKEIFSFFTPRSVAVVNKDDPFCDFLVEGVPGEKCFFGASSDDCEILADNGVAGYLLKIGTKETAFLLGGAHNLFNLYAGIEVARKMGVSISAIAQRVSKIRPVGARTHVLEGIFTIIDDCYNANPESIRSALTLLRAHQAGRRVAVLGDMFELGEDAEKEHQQLGDWISKEAVADIVLLVGPNMLSAAESAKRGLASVVCCESLDSVNDWLEKNIEEKDLVLVKGSRGMQLEKVVQELEKLQQRSLAHNG